MRFSTLRIIPSCVMMVMIRIVLTHFVGGGLRERWWESGSVQDWCLMAD